MLGQTAYNNSGNRFSDLSHPQTTDGTDALGGITDLSLDGMFLPWHKVCISLSVCAAGLILSDCYSGAQVQGSDEFICGCE